MTDLDERANTPTDPVREALQNIVDATRVGKPGTTPLKSVWASYPSKLYHHALAALTAPAAVGEVTQADREAAVNSGAHPFNKEIIAGEYDRHPLVQAFRDHRLQATRPAPAPNPSGDLELVTQAIADAQFGGPFNGLEWPEAWDHFETLAHAAILALSDRQAGEGWQPIETAPKDWKPVLVWAVSEEEWEDAADDDRAPNRSVLAARHSSIQPGNWWLVGSSMTAVKNPTHWRPLPTPPSTDTGEAA